MESVLIGDWDLNSEIDCDPDDDKNCLPAPVEFEIDEKIVHERYNKSRPSSPHDIALLRLTEKIEFGDLIKPICLPYDSSLLTKDYSGKVFTTAGWGKHRNNAL